MGPTRENSRTKGRGGGWKPRHGKKKRKKMQNDETAKVYGKWRGNRAVIDKNKEKTKMKVWPSCTIGNIK
jgi:hypothetical protein